MEQNKLDEVNRLAKLILTNKGMFEEFMVKLSTERFVNKYPYKYVMFTVHNQFLGKSNYIKRFEDMYSRCGSCIRRVQTNLLKHYKDAIWDENCTLEVRMVDNQDGRPLFRVKAEEAIVVNDTANGEDASKLEEQSSTPKQPPKKRGRKKKSTSTKSKE